MMTLLPRKEERMKRNKTIGAFCLGALLLSGCAGDADTRIGVFLDYDSSDLELSFAAQEIRAAGAKRNLNTEAKKGDYSIAFKALDSTLGEQAYTIEVEGKNIRVTGGDRDGLLYGGLEVAEEITLHGIDEVKSGSATPHILRRGLKFNAPLDMRTPSYTDVADSAQNSIPAMWDLNFWKNEFDLMARMRLNVFSLWNLNPFPSMVKVPEYPDVALNDVWRTKEKFDDTYSLIAQDVCRESFYDNYEVVKSITIDEKIAFWKEVMAYAHARGIEFDIFTWNTYTFGEHGKYNITGNLNDEVTKAYYRASVRELVKTYPDLDKIGVTSGEFMNNGNVAASVEECDRWLHDTYGEGIKDALKGTERKLGLVHRLHWSNMALVNTDWADFPYPIDFSDKYSRAHMYAATAPHEMDESLAALPAKQKLWLEVRNDDSFNYRWGDPSFARAYVKGMPSTQIRGFLIGPDGYVMGKEYAEKDPTMQGQLFLKKHWFNFTLFGRLGYDPDLSDETIAALFREHFATLEETRVKTLYDTLAWSSRVYCNISKLYFKNGDFEWYPEACTTHSMVFGFLTIRRWLMSTNVMNEQGVQSIDAYCRAIEAGANETTLKTPLDIATALEEVSSETKKGVAALAGGISATPESEQEHEFNGFFYDEKALAELAAYYAEKIQAVVALRLYNDQGDASKKAEAISHAQAGLIHWQALAAAFDVHYPAQRLGREGWLDPVAFTSDVESEVKQCENWTVGKM